MSGRGLIIFDGFCFTEATVTPGAISANTSSDVTVTLQGAKATDIILSVNKPTLTAGIDVGNARMTADNTMKMTFQNSTSATVTPATEIYTISLARPEKPPGSADGLSGGNVIF